MCSALATDYDGGDCCECTCDSLSLECGTNGYDCVDSSASCDDQDDSTGDDFAFVLDDDTEGSFSFSECTDEQLGDGDCDMGNNNELCGTSERLSRSSHPGTLLVDCWSPLLVQVTPPQSSRSRDITRYAGGKKALAASGLVNAVHHWSLLGIRSIAFSLDSNREWS